ncbi:MAG TPA: PQQ-binding-like beta-propeller repeat protein [Vicinamibacterales bacterium]|nr:PQQ-binding-like beta-propeller repeat protein [Vicinamibacterales bacterium]
MDRTPTFLTVMGATALVAVAALEGSQWGPKPPAPTPPTPTTLWHIAGQARSGAAADESTAYFVSKQHEVMAVDVATGEVRWRSLTGEWGDLHWGETAIAAGSVVVVGDYNLVAFDRKTGSPRWRFVPGEGYGPGIYMGAATATHVLTGSPAGRVYSVELETGRLHWSAVISALGKTTVFSPVSRGLDVAAGFSEFTLPGVGGVVMMAADSGRMRWKRHFPQPDEPTLSTHLGGGPLFDGDVVIAASGDGVIHAFDVATGEIKWSIPRVKPARPSLISPDRDSRALTITNGTLVSGSATGIVIGYDLGTREEKWRFHDPSIWSTAFRTSSAAGVAYIPYLSGMVVALDAGTGIELWRMGEWPAGFIWPPAFSGNRIIISGSGHGYVALPRVLPQ